MKPSKIVTTKTQNHAGDLSKIYFGFFNSDDSDTVIVIKHRVLVIGSDEFYVKDRFVLIKTFKGFKLYEKSFAVNHEVLINSIKASFN